MASTIIHAWWARKTTPSTDVRARRWRRRRRPPRRWLRFEMPVRVAAAARRRPAARPARSAAASDEGVHNAGRNRGQRPGRHECGQRERGGQRAAQVVDHLPSGDAGDRIAGRASRGVAGRVEDPRQELPVAARPPMLAGGRRRGSSTGTRRTARCRSPVRRGRRRPRTGRGSAACSRAPDRPSPPRTRRRRRCPCR